MIAIHYQFKLSSDYMNGFIEYVQTVGEPALVYLLCEHCSNQLRLISAFTHQLRVQIEVLKDG